MGPGTSYVGSHGEATTTCLARYYTRAPGYSVGRLYAAMRAPYVTL